MNQYESTKWFIVGENEDIVHGDKDNVYCMAPYRVTENSVYTVAELLDLIVLKEKWCLDDYILVGIFSLVERSKFCSHC